MTLDDIKKDNKTRQRFLREYSLVSGVEVCGFCASKLEGYFEHFQKLIKMNTDRKYELKPGLHWVAAFNDHVTNANLTDEKAEKMLAISPAYKKLFIRMPSEPVAPVGKVIEAPETFDEKLLSVDGIGKGFLKKIKALHGDEQSLLAAIESGESTGVDESFNEAIKKALSA
jgi:hypothetical protein